MKRATCSYCNCYSPGPHQHSYEQGECPECGDTDVLLDHLVDSDSRFEAAPRYFCADCWHEYHKPSRPCCGLHSCEWRLRAKKYKWRVTRNELIATFAGIVAVIVSWVAIDAILDGSTDEFTIPPLEQYADPYPYDSLIDGLYISMLRGETHPSDVASCDDLAHVYGRRTADVRRYWYFEFRDGVPLDSSRFGDASVEAFWRAGDDDLARAIGSELNSRCDDIGT